MTDNNIFNRIGGVEEASKKWGISPVTIKQMCQNGKLHSKKIGNSWAVDLEQPNPSIAATDLKIKGIKKAVGEFNNWVGAARIYYNQKTNEVWTNVYENGQSWDEYRDPDIIEVHAKVQMQNNWDKITMAQLSSFCSNSL